MAGEPAKRVNPRIHDNTDLRGLNSSDMVRSRTETSIPRAPSVASTTGSFGESRLFMKVVRRILQTLGSGGGSLSPFYYSSYFLRRSKIDFMKLDLPVSVGGGGLVGGIPARHPVQDPPRGSTPPC